MWVNRKVHLYIDANLTANHVMIETSMHYLDDLKDSKPSWTKNFVTYNLEIEKVILYFNDFSPDENEIGFETSVDGGVVRCSSSGSNMVLKWVLIMMFTMILELKWILMMVMMMIISQ